MTRVTVDFSDLLYFFIHLEIYENIFLHLSNLPPVSYRKVLDLSSSVQCLNTKRILEHYTSFRLCGYLLYHFLINLGLILCLKIAVSLSSFRVSL